MMPREGCCGTSDGWLFSDSLEPSTLPAVACCGRRFEALGAFFDFLGQRRQVLSELERTCQMSERCYEAINKNNAQRRCIERRQIGVARRSGCVDRVAIHERGEMSTAIAGSACGQDPWLTNATSSGESLTGGARMLPIHMSWAVAVITCGKAIDGLLLSIVM
jgi:hypothetical protein